MKKLFAILLALALVVSMTPALAENNVYRTLYAGEITTLNYLTTASTNEFALAANVIDTLVEYDKYGRAQPSLAESWETSADGLVWTFTLRKNATWVDYTGKVVANVVANDFVASARYILTKDNASSTATNLFCLSGAEAYYEGETTDFATVGVKALDEYTVQYTLETPVPYFLSSVTYVSFMPVNEAFLNEKGAGFGLATGPDTILYCGAFYLSEFRPQEKRVYTRNAANWDAERVYLDAIDMTFNKEASTIAPELYRRGEIDEASITNTIADEWLSSAETAELIHPVRQSGFYSYFYAFNFNPTFDAEYEPENWKLAVNVEAFRQSIFYGLDRLKAMLVIEPDNPEDLIFNTITPPYFVSLNNVDYTAMGPLAEITARDSFIEELAFEYKAIAIPELKAAGVTFPIKIMMPYNSSSTGWADECAVVEQQLETLLGTDYIDVIPVAYPSTGFLSATRRAGNYALQKCNWGPDYADPETYTDPFVENGGTYNKPERAVGYETEDGRKIYSVMLEAAKAETSDLTARYELFAEAEAFLINHAFVIPVGYGNGGYTAGRLNPFEGQYAPFGLSNERYKGQSLLDHAMSTDEYYDAMDAWMEAREETAN